MTGSVVVEIFGYIGEFRPSRSTIFISPPLNSKTTEPIFTIFSYYVEQLVELLMHVSGRRYPIPFRNDKAISVGGR